MSLTIITTPGTGGSGGSSAWTDITGKPSTFPPEAHTQEISTITGLQTALDAHTVDIAALNTALGTKQATLVSGTNLKTINGNSLLGSGDLVISGGGGGGGDASTNTSSSVDSEVALFSGVGGKTLKRATISGLAKLTSGVLSAATAGTDYLAPGGALGTPSSGTLTNATGLPTTGLVDGAVTLAKMANLSADTIIGRANGAGSGVPTALSAAQVLAILGITTGSGATAGEINTGTATDKAVTPDSLAGSNLGIRYFTLIGIERATDVATGDGKADFLVPAGMAGMNVVYALGAHITKNGSSGTTDIQLARVRAGSAVDILTNKLKIDFNEQDSTTAATAYTINTSNDDLAEGDLIRLDIDAIPGGTAPKGLIVVVGAQLP